jgi:hypothetical protein
MLCAAAIGSALRQLSTAIATRPGCNRSPASACAAGSGPDRDNSQGSRLRACSPMCIVTNTEPGKPGGSADVNSRNGARLPADPPTTTTSRGSTRSRYPAKSQTLLPSQKSKMPRLWERANADKEQSSDRHAPSVQD